MVTLRVVPEGLVPGVSYADGGAVVASYVAAGGMA